MVKSYGFYPKNYLFDDFIQVWRLTLVFYQCYLLQALCEYGIASKQFKNCSNHTKAEYLRVTKESNDPDVVNTFQFLYKSLKAKGITFDPLNKFSLENSSDLD